MFKRVEDLLSTYIASLLDEEAEKRQDGRDWAYDDRDLDSAWDELNEFLNPAGQRGDAGPCIPDELKKDFQTLKLEPGAPLAECRSAYRKLSKVHHPDRSNESGAAQFMRIKDAYDRIVKWYAEEA